MPNRFQLNSHNYDKLGIRRTCTPLLEDPQVEISNEMSTNFCANQYIHQNLLYVYLSRLGQVHTQAQAMSDTSKYVLTIITHCNHFGP